MQNKIYRLALSGDCIVSEDDLDGSYRSVNTLLEEIKIPSTILIDGLKADDAAIVKEVFDTLYLLRHSKTLYAAPIYFAKSMGMLDAFVDGVGRTKGEIAPFASEIVARMANLPIEGNAELSDLRLLTFLYCRGDSYSLAPIVFAGSPWVYEYPAAFLIGDFANTDIKTALSVPSPSAIDPDRTKGRSSAEWVVSLYTQGCLVTRDLVDRIRTCPHCHTGNLNYIDLCPLCGSLNFAKKKMIHCFTCGHVAPEDNFRSGMLFICPRCNTTLRHIGSDYDRPVETYSCNHCGQRFIEPEVKADCLKCRQRSATENLSIRQLYHYGIAAKAKRAVQLGAIDFEFSLFDSNRNVVPVYFYQVTDWLLQMRRRYSDEGFSLLCIKITGIDALERIVGITQIANLVDELAIRIRELVRLTDITTSTGANTFWILLPRTDQSGGEILASRIEKIADMVSLENGAHITLKVKCFSIPAEYEKRGPVAEILLNEYEDALGG